MPPYSLMYEKTITSGLDCRDSPANNDKRQGQQEAKQSSDDVEDPLHQHIRV